MKEKILKGSQGFEEYYKELYKDEWENLKEYLLKPTTSAEYKYENCASYFLDSASIIAALCIPLENAKSVLDLCAAPGGKTLVLASNINDDSTLNANERSGERKNRLLKVIASSLPEAVQKKIIVTCSDGATWCKRQTECFDSILLDAPCSSERHVLNDEKYLAQWTPSRIKTVSMEQWALLSSAYRMLKKNGFLLYATCSLATKENDDVIERLIKKFEDSKIISKDEAQKIFLKNLNSSKAKINFPAEINAQELFNSALQTKFGFHILPHKSKNSGPLYFSLIQKI